MDIKKHIKILSKISLYTPAPTLNRCTYIHIHKTQANIYVYAKTLYICIYNSKDCILLTPPKKKKKKKKYTVRQCINIELRDAGIIFLRNSRERERGGHLFILIPTLYIIKFIYSNFIYIISTYNILPFVEFL